MTYVASNEEGQFYDVSNDDAQKVVFDLGAFVGDLTVEEDASSDDISLEGLQQELEECKHDDVVVNILSKGTKFREHTKGVENNIRQVELDSIQDYIKESDNLVSLHDQIRDCDSILSQMETLLSGFQSEIGSISSDIKILQEKSMDMGLKLKNRKVAESKLAKFVEDIIVPPRMVDIIVEGEVNDEYMRTLEILSKKLKFVEVDLMVKTSKALKDVQPELEKLRQKAVSKVFDFIVQKLYALRKPKTNIQILQQNVLLKYKYVVSFLKEHGKEVYIEVRAAYIDTMNKVLSAHFRAYIQALEKLQLDIATSSDLIGVETRNTSLFSRGREPLKNRSAVFALGERRKVLKEIDEPALIPHIAEARSIKYPYEVLFRSLHKLLMDTATSEYHFCDDFFGEQSVFYEIFAGPFSVIDEHFNSILPNCYDAIGVMLMIRIIHQHQLIMSRRRSPCLDSYLDKVNIALWPRFKLVFDLHLNSMRNANVKTLWEDDVHPHYVMRRYAEFTASLIHLNVEYGDGQLELNLERLRMAIDDLLIKLANLFPKPKLQTVFLINNYDMTIAVLKEADPEGGKIQMHFEELLKSNTALFVEELLLEHFSDLIKFVKTRASEDPSASSEKPITVAEVEPLVKDFASRWKAAIELMHKDVITSFSNFLCGMEILRAALTQLLLYYTRLSDWVKMGMPTYSFSVQASHLTSMADEGFDFNACIYNGISYLSRAQESAAKARIGNPTTSSYVMSSSSTPTVADTVFVERIKSRVKHWKSACKNTKKDNALLSSLRKIVMGSEIYGTRPCMNLDVCSERQVQLALEMLKEFSDELVPLIIPARGGGTQAVRVVLTSSTADKDLFERELQNLEEEQNKRVRGFREVIDLISASQKPVVSHNSLNDFTVIHSEFLSPLPTNVDEFMGSLHSVFTHILDVTHLMKNIGPLRKMTNISAAISYLNNHYFAPIDMEILPQESEGNIHRHNVVKMCYLFAKLCSILKISDNAMVSNNALLAPAIEEYTNISNPCSDSPQESTNEDIRVWTKNMRKVSCDQLVFLWGFRSGMTAGMIKSLLCKSHAIFSEEFDVRLVDKSCAIVVFWQRGLSETFLDAMSREEICDSLMEIASEGIRASSYETYKRVCRLGLWEADLAESLDKALEDLDYLAEVNSATNSKKIYWSSNSAINFDDL